MKTRIYLSRTIVIIFVLFTRHSYSTHKDDENIIISCSPYHLGSYFIYSSTSENRSSIYKEFVVSSENGIIQIVRKFYDSNLDQPQSISTLTLTEKDGSITLIKDKTESGFLTTTYLKPYPICGVIPKEVKSIYIQEMKIGGRESKDTITMIASKTLIGQEIVRVKAGEFKAIVIETKFSFSNAPSGSIISIDYYVQGLGIVKNVSIMKTLVPDYSENISNQEPSLDDINKGLKDLENGKDISWLDSLYSSPTSNRNESSVSKTTTMTTTTTLELVEYKIN